jgi:hypothetical protein
MPQVDGMLAKVRYLLLLFPGTCLVEHAFEKTLHPFYVRSGGEPGIQQSLRREPLHLGAHSLFQFSHHRGLERLHIWKSEELASFFRRAFYIHGDFHALPPSA